MGCRGRVGTPVDARLAPPAPGILLSCPLAQGRAEQDKGSSRRQLPASARRGGRGHPGRPPPPRPREGGQAPAFVCASAEGRVRRKRAPSCGRSRALRPGRRGATLARSEPPSLDGILAGTAVSQRRRLPELLRCVLLDMLCVRETHYHS